MKGYKSVQFVNHDRPFELFENVTPVCVEVYENSEPLTTFVHPENALYVFGPEDGTVPTSDSAPLSSICAHPVALLFEPERGGQRSPRESLDVAAIVGHGATVAAS